MAHQANKDEKQVLNYIFKECSQLEYKEQVKNINTYYAIKYHIPSEMFSSNKLKFNYNKGVSYILASFGDILLFKIPNNNTPIEIICPPDKNFINSLDTSDTNKENTIKRYKNTKAKYWYIKLTADELLSYSSTHWTTFKSILTDIATS